MVKRITVLRLTPNARPQSHHIYNLTYTTVQLDAKDEIVSYLKQFWKLLEKLPIPPVATLSIAGAVLLIILICCCCCCYKCCSCCCSCCKTTVKDEESEIEDSFDLATMELRDVPEHERSQPSVDEMDYSVAGFFEEEDVEGTVLGRVNFGMQYNEIEQSLTVTIFEATDLPSADEEGASDPYIRVMLLPDTKRRFETMVLDDTLDPVYNQTFVFKGIPHSEISNRVLCIQALDFDTFASHDVLGEVRLPLIDVNLAEAIETEWRILVPGYDGETGNDLLHSELLDKQRAGILRSKRRRTEEGPTFRQSVSEYGDICISLRYIPTTKKLFVFLLECQNLRSTDPSGVSDPYVRIVLIQDGKKIKKKKSTVKKQTLNPYYNEKFIFMVAPDKVEQSALQFNVMDYDLIGKADLIGQVTIGVNTYGPQLRHWRDMLRNPSKPCPQWHMLRPKMSKDEQE
eukprot:gene12747-14053_t